MRTVLECQKLLPTLTLTPKIERKPFQSTFSIDPVYIISLFLFSTV
jgi:hypothetical protein